MSTAVDVSSLPAALDDADGFRDRLNDAVRDRVCAPAGMASSGFSAMDLVEPESVAD